MNVTLRLIIRGFPARHKCQTTVLVAQQEKRRSPTSSMVTPRMAVEQLVERVVQ